MTRALVVGAGIGGLTTAPALRAAGIETAIFERAAGMRELEAQRRPDAVAPIASKQYVKIHRHVA